MHKLYKIIYFNLIFLLFILGIVEIYNYKMYDNKYSDLLKAQSVAFAKNSKKKEFYKIRYHFTIPFEYEAITDKLKNYSGTKRGIITIGCSYTKGVGLEPNQTFAAKLNKYTGRTTYNRGISATGTQMVYRQLSDKNFKREVPDAEYVIYTFIWDHFFRMFRPLFSPCMGNMSICYRLENKDLRGGVFSNNRLENTSLVEIKHPFYPFYFLFTVRNFLDNKSVSDTRKEFATGCPLFLKTVEESQKMMKKLYPNSKFVLLEFPQGTMCDENYVEGRDELKEPEIKKLEDMGVIYINAEKLVGHKLRDVDKYRIADKDHPNERAWDEIVPKLAQKLNL